MRTEIGRILKKFGIKKQVIKALNKTGLNKGYNTGDFLLDIKLLLERSSNDVIELIKSANGKNVAIAGVIPSMSEHIIVTTIIDLSLRLRGINCVPLICDKSMRACDLIHFTNFTSEESFLETTERPKCDSCYDKGVKIFNVLNLPFEKLSKYLKDNLYYDYKEELKSLSLAEIFNYKAGGIDLGEQVRTSVHRYFMKGIFDYNEEERRVAVQYLVSGLQYLDALDKFNKEFKPDTYICTQGIYLMGGITDEYCRANGLNFVAWDYQYRKNGILVSLGDTYHHELRKEPNSTWEERTLNKEQNKELDDYFFSRREGKLDKDEISYTKDSVTDSGLISENLKIDKNKPVVVLFTNVAWDGKVAVSSNVFEGPVELVLETLEYLKENKDIQFIVRIHPAENVEKKWAGLQRMDELIQSDFPNLPDNIKIILPEEKISSYGLAKLANVSVVYSTKLGLELMLMGLPVIITGDAFYQNKGFGYQPKTKDEYRELLYNAVNIPKLKPDEIERVRRYAYHFFYRRTLIVPSLYKSRQDSIIINKIDDLLPGKNKDVDRLCDGIIHNVPFHLNN